MFDIAWSEMAVIAGVALLVIGPKDLPKVLRTVGQWTSKARSLAHEFQSAIEELANEDDLKDIKKQIESDLPTGLGSEFSADALANTIDPDGELRKSLDSLNHHEKTAASDENSIEAHVKDEPQPTAETQAAEALAAELVEPPTPEAKAETKLDTEAEAGVEPVVEAAEKKVPEATSTAQPATEQAAKPRNLGEPAEIPTEIDEPPREKKTGTGVSG
jgi:sec-independent protein translocase protein TatB